MALQLEEEENFCYATQLVFSSVLSMSMQSAIELGVFDIIAKAGPGAKLSSSEIAAHIGKGTRNSEAPMMLDRILRLLASHSILSCSAAANEEDGSQLKDAVVEGGIPFNKVHGKHAFEYPGLDARFNQVFNTAMFNHTTIVMKKILHLYKGFEKLTQLVDVGGGLGVTLRDMFASVPSGDAIFMKWILHDWSDQHCLKLLKNCYNAIPDDGKVIIVEALLPVMPETSTAVKSTSQIDVLMMTQNPGGKERSREEFMALATGAGFSGIKYECFVCNFWVMEIFK
ncbi:caffeic acid 3-O-methyltransferase 1-like [Pyrus ussuriensis x Pyrus communis]|uniref:Caffeic acid 3-O-methyltransferase 1-like n=1 Tax=Pyrus ussuriensis x Pyrus communis TaxID=2448454 RepID=A0A5N5F4B7_9ROSA|nr:caffeic acid 3-O-methyltransferase 1-like [Pyrus ussuriensis x Pyrus communis]